MTKTDYYDYVNDFYVKYTKNMTEDEALLFNRWLTRIRILCPVFEIRDDKVKNQDIKEYYIYE